MTRWLVTFDDAIAEAETAAQAVEKRYDDDSIPYGARVYVIDLDAIEGTDRCVHMEVGAFPIRESAETMTAEPTFVAMTALERAVRKLGLAFDAAAEVYRDGDDPGVWVARVQATTNELTEEEALALREALGS